MDVLAAQGRQAEALALYERVRETLADVLGTDPGAALRERHLRLLRAERAPAADAARTRPSNLPAPLTSFIGRDDDLARIDTLLAAGRLVTVLGPGGAGKTRLAVEAARRHRHEFRDGTWLIDLASVTEPAKVGAAVLAGIGLRGAALFEARMPGRGRRAGRARRPVRRPGEPARGRQLRAPDRRRRAPGRGLLPRCSGLRVLATSREPLAVDGEALVPLGPLRCPGRTTARAAAGAAAAVRLFTERAAAVRPASTWTRRRSREWSGGPRPGRHAAGAGAGRGPAADAVAGRARRRAVRPVPAAHHRQPDRAAAAPHAARGHRLELGPAQRARAYGGRTGLGPARRRHAGLGHRGLCRHRGAGRARSPSCSPP